MHGWGGAHTWVGARTPEGGIHLSPMGYKRAPKGIIEPQGTYMSPKGLKRAPGHAHIGGRARIGRGAHLSSRGHKRALGGIIEPEGA
jgi:hypothetical protein